MKEIIGFPMYTLDEDGNVYSRYIKGGGGSVSNNYRKLKPVIDITGYYIVSLIREDGKKIKKSIHRLLGELFIPNPENKEHINHKDGNKLNNRIDNLEWCTPKENFNHAVKLGLVDLSHKNKWVSIDQFNFSGEFIKTYPSLAIAQKETNVPYPNIVKVCKGLRKSAGGYIWKYSETSETIPERE